MMLAATIVVCVVHVGVESAPQQTSPTSAADRRAVAGAPIRNFHMPPPIGREMLERLAGILRLSQEQRFAVETCFTHYQRQQQALEAVEMPGLLNRAAAVAVAVRSQGQDILFAERDRVVKIRLAIDEALFAAIEVILADDQRARLKRVRDIREHQVSRVFHSRVPGSNEDVSLMVHELCRKDDTAMVDSTQLEEALAAYDATAAVLWKSYQQRSMEAMAMEYELFGPTMDPLDAEANTRSLKRMQDFNAGTYRLEERLRLMNVQCLNGIQSFLSEGAAASLRRDYYSSAFPEVYPDPHAVSEVLACLQSEPVDDAQIGDALSAIRIDYERKHASISTRMIDRCLAWWAWHRIEGLNDSVAFNAYMESMVGMQAERASIAMAALARAEEAVGNLQQSCRALITEYREATAQHKPVVTGYHVRP